MRRSTFMRKATPYLFCVPFLAFFVVFFLAPLSYAVYLSFFRETLVGGFRFNGVANYVAAISDPILWRGVGNVLTYGLVLVPVLLGLGLALALMLDSRYIVGRPFFQVALFLPYAVPGVIATLIWAYMYSPTFGPITQMVTATGLPGPPLLHDGYIFGSLANISIWGSLGYNMIIVFAALQAISPDLDEAASLDGASEMQYALKVKVPLVIGAVMLNAIFSIISTLQLFSEPTILSALVPHVIDASFTPNMYTRSIAFTSQDFSYAAALSFILAAVAGLLSALVMVIGGRFRRT